GGAEHGLAQADRFAAVLPARPVDGGERGELVRADGAFGADDDGDLAGGGEFDPRERSGGLLVQHQDLLGSAEPLDEPLGGVEFGHVREVGAAGLLGGLAGGGGPFGAGLLSARPLPLGDGAGGGPRDDLVDADLGEHLHGPLAAVAFGQGL